jgi:glutathione reductase (NADPH)
MIETLAARTGPERMVMKLITEAGKGRVLGVHVLGPGAAEMIQMVAPSPWAWGRPRPISTAPSQCIPRPSEELVTFRAPSYAYRDGVKQ